MSKLLYTIGTDPELFLSKNGRYVSATEYTDGTKYVPEFLSSGGFVSYDNVALEFGVAPAITYDEFIWNIGATILDLKNYLPDDIKMNIVASAHFPRSELKHKEAKRFGCDPDMNAWTGLQNATPRKAKRSTFRTCGGHVHIRHIPKSGSLGFLKHQLGKVNTVFALDLTGGLVSTVLDSDPSAIERRSLYGKAGCYRSTDGGIEYRTLSNYWIKSPSLVKLIHLLVDEALSFVSTDQVEAITCLVGGPQNLQRVITEGDWEMATLLVENILLPRFTKETQEQFSKCFAEIDTYIFEKEWEIE